MAATTMETITKVVAAVTVTGISTMKGKAEGLEAKAMFTRGTTTEALSQKEVPSGGPELNSGTGKGSRQMMLRRTLSPSRVVGRIMTSISRIKMKRVINLYGFLVVYRSKVLFSGI